jgi:hypothetical protein
VWNRISDDIQHQSVEMALDYREHNQSGALLLPHVMATI